MRDGIPSRRAGSGGSDLIFNLVVIAQSGRLQAEAALFMASLAAAEARRDYRVIVAEPEPGPLWPGDPGIDDPEIREFRIRLGAETLRFPSRVFGSAYPHGNKIEVLGHLPKGEPFLFLDTDTLVLGPLSDVPFDFSRPSASLRRSDTWPKIRPGGPSRSEIWAALYDRFGLDFAASQDFARTEDDWQRYLYFNAGYFYGSCPRVFGELFQRFAREIRDDPPAALKGQKLDPWLDQVTLPLVIAALGGGRDTLEPGWLDGRSTLHYRALPLLYARESDAAVDRLEMVAAPNRIKKLLKRYRPFRRMIYRGDGRRIRVMFDRDALPDTEREIRKRIRAEGLWLR